MTVGKASTLHPLLSAHLGVAAQGLVPARLRVVELLPVVARPPAVVPLQPEAVLRQAVQLPARLPALQAGQSAWLSALPLAKCSARLLTARSAACRRRNKRQMMRQEVKNDEH